MPIDPKEALQYHEDPPGKIATAITKPLTSQEDLSLAYSPGVAIPCNAIEKDASKVYNYTAKGNLVAVISNGTAVLGLGDIGALASKPVMEGKAILFKKFAGIDSYDLEINEADPYQLATIIQSLEPTFGGINLEDIKAPDCFIVEEILREKLHIPIMHDDQHGTAIIIAAGLQNALELVNKELKKVRIIINGAGAGAIACGHLLLELGVQKGNLLMFDSKGLITQGRENLHSSKTFFATTESPHSLTEACRDADVFIGLSRADVLPPKAIAVMADQPIVFALANPDPEIAYELAIKTRDDLIMATGRSDYPNQVNNALGFPYIFRGALDVRATTINEPMKLAAVKALADLAKEPMLKSVCRAYKNCPTTFGKEYIMPKPIDPRLITRVAPAVAKAAIDSKVATKKINDWDAYKEELKKRIQS